MKQEGEGGGVSGGVDMGVGVDGGTFLTRIGLRIGEPWKIFGKLSGVFVLFTFFTAFNG